MASPPNGYRTGPRVVVKAKVAAATSDIKAGDALFGAAAAGYVQQAAAGEAPVGISTQDVDSPSANGDVTCLMDVSPLSQYEYPPDAGTVTQALANTTMDLGGPQSIDIDASTDDIFTVDEVDTVNNTVTGRFTFTPLGVV